MEYNTTIEFDNCIKQVSFKQALYMDTPLWEISLDDKTFLVKKDEQGFHVSSDCNLAPELIAKIGDAIDYFNIRDAS
jgi:hypothetical protein